MTGASPGEQKANSSDPALREDKHSQSRPLEVINKRQHNINAQEIPLFYEKKEEKHKPIFYNPTNLVLKTKVHQAEEAWAQFLAVPVCHCWEANAKKDRSE